MAKQTKQQIKKHTEQEAKIIQEVEDDDTDEEVVEEVEDDDTDDDDDDEEYKKALLMIEMIKKKKTEKAQKKADMILDKIVNGAVYLQKVEEYEKIKNHADNLKKEMVDYLETEKEANGYNLLVKTAKKSVGGGGGGGGSKTEPNTTTDIKKDLENGNYALYSLIVNGDNYKLCYDKNIYHFGNVSVPCGKKDNKTNYVLSYQYCVENKINSLNKIGNYVFGSSTNIYTKLKKV